MQKKKTPKTRVKPTNAKKRAEKKIEEKRQFLKRNENRYDPKKAILDENR
jgi:hypothetical protein